MDEDDELDALATCVMLDPADDDALERYKRALSTAGALEAGHQLALRAMSVAPNVFSHITGALETATDLVRPGYQLALAERCLAEVSAGPFADWFHAGNPNVTFVMLARSSAHFYAGRLAEAIEMRADALEGMAGSWPNVGYRLAHAAEGFAEDARIDAAYVGLRSAPSAAALAVTIAKHAFARGASEAAFDVLVTHLGRGGKEWRAAQALALEPAWKASELGVPIDFEKSQVEGLTALQAESAEGQRRRGRRARGCMQEGQGACAEADAHGDARGAFIREAARWRGKGSARPGEARRQRRGGARAAGGGALPRRG